MAIHGRFGLRSWLSMIFGLGLFVVGGVPFLNTIGAIDFSIPSLGELILRILFIVAGALLLLDAQHEIYNNKAFMWVSIVCGIPVLILGIIPVLHGYGAISFGLPAIPTAISDVLTGVAGVILFIDAWKSE